MKLSFKSYIRYLRKQHVHVQKVHALVFSGTICAVLGSLILYSQYGFWHATYIRGQEEAIAKETSRSSLKESPLEILSRLVIEGKERLGGIASTSKSLIESDTIFDRNAMENATTTQ